MNLEEENHQVRTLEDVCIKPERVYIDSYAWRTDYTKDFISDMNRFTNKLQTGEIKMNKEEILKEIEKTKQHLTNMEKMLKECDERWKPKDNEKFWYIDSSGLVNYSLFMSETESRFKNYNCFQTREQAEQEAEKILARRMLEDIARRLNKGEKIDWNNNEQSKYYIELYCNNIITNFHYCHKIQGTVYCLDKNFKDIAFQKIGEERLVRYLKGE